jgi:histidine triad (HIT) family protein
MSDCLFCKIVNGEIPATIVLQNEQVLAFRDINPQAPTHVLIIPKKHVESFHELTTLDGEMLAAVSAAAQQIAKEEGITESGYRVVTNIGEGAGQSVFHLHFHLLGGRPLHWPPG